MAFWPFWQAFLKQTCYFYYLARSANLPEGLYIFLCILVFMLFVENKFLFFFYLVLLFVKHVIVELQVECPSHYTSKPPSCSECGVNENFCYRIILDAVAPSRFLTEVVSTHTWHPRSSRRCHT